MGVRSQGLTSHICYTRDQVGFYVNKSMVMARGEDQNKLTALSIKQNLLLWQISQSFLDVEKKILKSVKVKSNE